MFGEVSLTLPSHLGAREVAQLTRALEVLGSGPVFIVLHGARVESVSRGAQALLESAHLLLQHPDAQLRIADPSPALSGDAEPVLV